MSGQFVKRIYDDDANLLATSRCSGIWETTRHNRLWPAPPWHSLRCGLVVYVADLLLIVYGETGMMDFGQY